MTRRSVPDQLPPEREWTDLMGHADRVIAEVGRVAPRRRRRRTGYVVPAIAAAVAAVVAALGVDLLSNPVTPSVTATPSVTVAPSAPVTPPVHVPSRGMTLKPLRVGETAELTHAEITVNEVASTGRGVAVMVQTCVVAPLDQFPTGLPVHIGDWMAVRNDHSGVAVARARESELKPAYPNAVRVSQGACVAGWIPPLNPPGEGEISLIYRGELGGEARWLLE
jgi:hypothetical protein